MNRRAQCPDGGTPRPAGGHGPSTRAGPPAIEQDAGVSSDRPDRPRDTDGLARKVAASLATVAAAAAVVALPSLRSPTDERMDFTDSVLAPVVVDAVSGGGPG